ncbi:MAG: restriction endonuclease [Candidatus Shapirobacteria bacterium]|nr:restriction endonuclease [Candidatus Shapirobacteria bacterium]
MGLLVKMIRASAREANRQARLNLAYQKRVLREEEAHRKQMLRAKILDEKEKARQYLQSQLGQTEALKVDLSNQIKQLSDRLKNSLLKSYNFSLDKFIKEPDIKPFNPGKLNITENEPELEDYLPKELGLLKLIPGVKNIHKKRTEEAEINYNKDVELYKIQEKKRKEMLLEAKKNYNKEVEKIIKETKEKNNEIFKLKDNFTKKQPQAVVEFFSWALEFFELPTEFPSNTKLAYIPESKQLVIEYDLPPFEIIPLESSCKYIKSSDKILSIPASITFRKNLYTSFIAQESLRILNIIFSIDKENLVESLVFNGYVNSINSGTGKDIRPCIITIRTTDSVFKDIDLSRIDPISCLKTLDASFSKNPSELAPVRPVLEFNMVDSRFIEASDVLSELDQRPNLMDLTPGEFESLITNLFEKMGLETRLTQASRDGGVDCVAYDPRPIFGGKVVIQAKRYKNTVGVSAVRDLFGTVQNEGASKGILVTTSGYGKAAFDFAAGKPLELLSGTNLLYLLENHAGIKATIKIPDNWKDPQSDN